ncbi:hypothetical protein [Nonomuraea terrae]|uniref:hypothetical protein n=1 Tax=Nonomuraea terrae TaxID=2530383 RepID=UPI001651BC17|nr:hypothetical protein [Nonomuraea terrae]
MDDDLALQRRIHDPLRGRRPGQGADAQFHHHRARHGEGDPSVLADFRAMLDGMDPEDYRGKRSAAFTFIEAQTGMGIESDWLDVEDVPVIVMDDWHRS